MSAQKRPVLIVNQAGETLATVEAYNGPVSIAVRRVGWRKLVEAERLNQVAASQHVSQIGGPRVLREMQEAAAAALGAMTPSPASLGDAPAPDARQALEAQLALNPLAAYDPLTLLYGGITSIEGCPSTQDLGPVIDELEIEVAEACALAILKLSRPSLFETEADRKNA